MRNVDKMVTKFKTLIYVILLLSFYSLFHWTRVGVQITILTATCTFYQTFCAFQYNFVWYQLI